MRTLSLGEKTVLNRDQLFKEIACSLSAEGLHCSGKLKGNHKSCFLLKIRMPRKRCLSCQCVVTKQSEHENSPRTITTPEK